MVHGANLMITHKMPSWGVSSKNFHFEHIKINSINFAATWMPETKNLEHPTHKSLFIIEEIATIKMSEIKTTKGLIGETGVDAVNFYQWSKCNWCIYCHKCINRKFIDFFGAFYGNGAGITGITAMVMKERAMSLLDNKISAPVSTR